MQFKFEHSPLYLALFSIVATGFASWLLYSGNRLEPNLSDAALNNQNTKTQSVFSSNIGKLTGRTKKTVSFNNGIPEASQVFLDSANQEAPSPYTGRILIKSKSVASFNSVKSRALSRVNEISGIKNPGQSGLAWKVKNTSFGATAPDPKGLRQWLVLEPYDTQALKTQPTKLKYLVEDLKKLSEVQSVEAESAAYVFQSRATSKLSTSSFNDPYFKSSNSWGQGFDDLWGIKKISAPSIWAATQGLGVVVAIIDTGVDTQHEDLAQNIWQNPGETGKDSSGQDKRSNNRDDDNNGFIDDFQGWNFVDYSNNVFDDNLHGTHVAGTVAAVGNNNIGVVGVAPQAKVMSIKVLSSSGSGSYTDVATGIKYAADNGAKVINLSLGGTDSNEILRDAITYAHDKNVVIIAAAGNNSMPVYGKRTTFYPANYSEVICVGAANSQDQIASFSNYGDRIDLYAPGGGDTTGNNAVRSVLSLKTNLPGILPELTLNNKYLRLAGTSMATPHVSGATALLLASKPNLSNEEIRQLLKIGSDKTIASKFPGYGYYGNTQSPIGRLNVASSLKLTDAPQAYFYSPSELFVAGNTTLSLSGKIAGQGIAWTLAYKQSNASDWTTFASGNTPKAGLITNWNLSGIGDGLYTIKLQVKDGSGKIAENIQNIYFDNLKFSNLKSGEINIFASLKPIEVRGIAAPNDSNWDIQLFNEDFSPLPGVLTKTSSGRVVSGLLATIDTKKLSTGFYSLQLVNRNKHGEEKEITTIAIDTSRLNPVYSTIAPPIMLDPGWFLSFVEQPTVADINNDKRAEIIASYNQLYALDAEGKSLPGYPFNLSSLSNNYNNAWQSPVIVTDLNLDEKKEILVTQNGYAGVYALSGNGGVYADWLKPDLNGAIKLMAAGNLQGSSEPEVVVVSNAPNGLTLLSSKGEVLGQLSAQALIGSHSEEKQLEYRISPSVLADFNGDKQLDIALHIQKIVWDSTGGTSAQHIIKVYDGTLKELWQVNLGNSLFEELTPVATDANQDGKAELVVVTNAEVVMVSNGKVLWRRSGLGRMTMPTLGDLYGNGEYYVVVNCDELDISRDKICVFKALTGETLNGWPKILPRKSTTSGRESWGIRPASALGDIDGDGELEIIAASSMDSTVVNDMYWDSFDRVWLYAYKLNGSQVPGFPKPLAAMANYVNMPYLADLTGDTIPELGFIDHDFNFYTWLLPHRLTLPTKIGRLDWPQLGQNSARTRFLSNFSQLQTPEFKAEGVVNSASYNAKLTPMTQMSVFGSRLADKTCSPPSGTVTELCGVKLSLGNQPVQLLYVSPAQINFVSPKTLSLGNQNLTLSTSSGQTSQSVQVTAKSPGLYSKDGSGKNLGVIQVFKRENGKDTYTQVSNTAPAKIGDIIVIYGTGLGVESPDKQLADLTLTINNVPAKMLYAGPQGVYPGQDQINAEVPSGLTPNLQGYDVELCSKSLKICSNKVKLPIGR